MFFRDSQTNAHKQYPWLRIIMVVGLLGYAAVSGCESGQDAPAPTRAPSPDTQPVLRIGTAASAPPFVFIENEDVVGLEIDLAHELAKRLGRQPRVVSMFFDNLPEELRRNRVDIIMAGMSITPNRLTSMAFAEPYLRTGQQILIHTEDSALVSNATDLNQGGTRIGVEHGSTGMAHAQKVYGQAVIHEFPTLADAVDALHNRKITAVISDAPAIAWVVRHDTSESLHRVPGLLTDEPIAWAINPDSADLIAEVNDALIEMRDDGTLDRLLNKWIEPQ